LFIDALQHIWRLVHEQYQRNTHKKISYIWCKIAENVMHVLEIHLILLYVLILYSEW